MGQNIVNHKFDKGLISIYICIKNPTQYQKKSVFKNGQRIQILSQGRHTDVQQAHDKIFNTTNQQVNAYQNHNQILPHTYENDYYQKDKI